MTDWYDAREQQLGSSLLAQAEAALLGEDPGEADRLRRLNDALDLLRRVRDGLLYATDHTADQWREHYEIQRRDVRDRLNEIAEYDMERESNA